MTELLFQGPTSAPEPDPVDLQVWWKMNEGTGTALADSSGNGYGATLLAGSNWVTGPTGSPNTAVQFDGITQHVETRTLGTWAQNITGTLAIDFWAKWTHSSSMLRFMGSSTSSGTDYTLLGVASYRDNPGDIDVFLRGASDSGNRYWVTTTSGGFNDGNWHRIQVTKSGNAAGNLVVIVDGANQALTVKDRNMSGGATNFDRYLALAAFNNGGTIGNLAPCSLADVRLHHTNQDIWIP